MSVHVNWMLLSCCAIILFCGCGDSSDLPPSGTASTYQIEPLVEPQTDALSVVVEPANRPEPLDEPPADATASDAPRENASETAGQPIVDEVPSAEEVYPEPDYVLTATELATAYKDKDEYKKNYSRKKVEVTGIVHGYDNDGWGSEVRVALETGVEFENIFTDNKVFLVLKEEAPWARYPPGSKLTLRGEVKSDMEIAGGFISPHSAMVVRSEPGEALPEFSPASFLELEDRDRTRRQWVILKGPISAITVEHDDTDTKHIYLGDESEQRLHLSLLLHNDDYQHHHTRELKAGDSITVLAKYESTHEDVPLFRDVFLIDPLPGLPALPTTVLRPVRFAGDEPHMYFTADLLGEWMNDPRALGHMIERREQTLCELHGEIAEVRPSELDDTDVYVLFKNESDNDVRYVLKKDSSEMSRLKPGQTVSVQGTLDVAFSREPYAYVTK